MSKKRFHQICVNFLGYAKFLVPLLFLLIPFGIWLFNEYHDYNKENLFLWTSFIPILSYIIGLLTGILLKTLTENRKLKEQYNTSSYD